MSDIFTRVQELEALVEHTLLPIYNKYYSERNEKPPVNKYIEAYLRHKPPLPALFLPKNK